MDNFAVKPIRNSQITDMSKLINESKLEGYRFVGRLEADYKNGINTFSRAGEALCGVFDIQGSLVAIGGVNQDPFSNDPTIGRLRRFYVSGRYRRKGVGTLLLQTLVNQANMHYQRLDLQTPETSGADFFMKVLDSQNIRSIHMPATI